MPENQTPATQPPADAGEFNFAHPATENPRIKRRTLKTKPVGLIKPAAGAIPAARELEREAPPLSAEQVVKPASVKTEEIVAKSAAKAAETPVAPPRTTPAASATATGPAFKSTATPSPAASPHGTRPATLYYSSTSSATTRKAETPSPMKTIPTASTASSPSATAVPTSAARTTTTAAASRPSSNVDYRANVERQSREQKSVGSILSYVVYGLIAFFVISAALAAYGADVIFARLHDQSATVSQLDQHYTKLTADLSTKLSATQDTLAAAQAQITRQQDLIVHQQEAINQLLASTSANEASIKQEKAARAQDSANLRARVKELEYRNSQKY